jgi:hypothetical protein
MKLRIWAITMCMVYDIRTPGSTVLYGSCRPSFRRLVGFAVELPSALRDLGCFLVRLAVAGDSRSHWQAGIPTRSLQWSHGRRTGYRLKNANWARGTGDGSSHLKRIASTRLGRDSQWTCQRPPRKGSSNCSGTH